MSTRVLALLVALAALSAPGCVINSGQAKRAVVIAPALARVIEGMERGGGAAAVNAKIDEIARAVQESREAQVVKDQIVGIQTELSCKALLKMAQDGEFPSDGEWSDWVVEAFVGAGLDAANIPPSVQQRLDQNLMPAVLASVPPDDVGAVTDESASDVYTDLGCESLGDLEV